MLKCSSGYVNFIFIFFIHQMILTATYPATDRLQSLNSKSTISSDYPVPSSMITDLFLNSNKRASRVTSSAQSIHTLSTATKVDSLSYSTYSILTKVKLPTLKLETREIELVRYTWNKMLLEEPILKYQSAIPGAFPNDSEIAHQNSLNKKKTFNANSMALLLFCRQLYGNLLSASPELESLFPLIKHQAAAMGGVLSLVILQLGNIEVLNSYLTGLAKRHSRILGIERPQFELMGEALVKTFVERFGTKFTHELEELWVRLYVYIAGYMLAAGEDPVLDPSDGMPDFDVGVSSDVETISSGTLVPDVGLLDDVVSELKVQDRTFESTVAQVEQTVPAPVGSDSKPLPPKPTLLESAKRRRRLKRENCVVM